MPFSWITDFFKGAADKGPVGNLYADIVAQARSEIFYRELGVKDDVDGRFDMIAIHYFLAMDRMRLEATLEGLSQKLANLVIADMDRSLREMGVGDMKVGKKVQDMGLALYGRLEMYDIAMMESDSKTQYDKLSEAIMRNVFRSEEAVSEVANEIASYVIKQKEFLANLSAVDIAKGHMNFADAKELINDRK